MGSSINDLNREDLGPRERPLVLVADDEPDTRRLVATRLELAGCDVAEAVDGEQALSMVHERNPDLAVIDVMMPGKDGYEVVEALQAQSSTRTMPVILLTARVQQEDAYKGFESGADEYITKPFDSLELASRVHALLSSRERPDA